MKTKHVNKVFDLFGRKVVQTARGILAAQGKNSSGNLSSSLGYFLKVDQGTLELRFLGEPYARIVDEGIKGAKSSAKAPKSPFKFTGSKQMVNIGAIDKWVVRKGLKAARNAQGRFISRKSLVRSIARKLYLFGKEPSYYFSDALNEGLRTLPRQYAKAYAKDAAQFINTVTKEM